MSALLFALVAAFTLSIGARDQLLIADLRARLGSSPGLLAVGVLSAAGPGALAGWAGGEFSDLLSVNTAQMFVAMALLLASFELAWPNRGKPPAEPTRSLFAIGIGLALRQVTDAARFVVFALGAALAFPQMAALGGAIGGMAAVATGYALGDRLRALPHRAIRLALAAIVFIGAILIGISVRFY
jgi:Ca2+/H+ antiporter, TMEM165/GDT1 family